MTEGFDVVSELSKDPSLISFPGDLFMRGGAKDYVGAVLCVRASLFFKGGHTSTVREMICSCFDKYVELSGNVFTWLWRENPAEGAPKLRYGEAPSLHDMILNKDEDEILSLCYTAGEKSEDASAWQFLICGQRGWESKIGQEYSVVEFSIPIDAFDVKRTDFLSLVVSCSSLLEAEHGYAGYALNVSTVRRERNEPVEALVSERMPGLSVGTASLLANEAALKDGKIITVNWLTIVNYSRLSIVGGVLSLLKNLPSSHYKIYDYGAGAVIQSGAEPKAMGEEGDLRPPAYIILDHQLCDIRVFSIGNIHRNSKSGEFRLTGWSADQWLRRFDVAPSEMPLHLRRLMNEPPLEDKDILVQEN